jgi:hypothetical protein
VTQRFSMKRFHLARNRAMRGAAIAMWGHAGAFAYDTYRDWRDHRAIFFVAQGTAHGGDEP